MKEQIRSFLLEAGADVCGFGNVERFLEAPEGFTPTDLWRECKSVISIGVALPKGLSDVPSRLIYAHYNENTCRMVDDLAFYGAKEIERLGGIAIPLPSDAPYEYWDADTMTGKGLLSMKHVAQACGVGRIGKSALLLNAEYGNMLTLGAILTNLDLESDPYAEVICIPGCRKCMDACPVHAIHETHVVQKECRANTYGKTARGFDTVDCNQCRMVCPMRFGKKGRKI